VNFCVAHNMIVHEYEQIRFTTSARKHRVGKASALHVIHGYAPEVLDLERYKLVWVGFDERGREIELSR
jgi:hypothetical protein